MASLKDISAACGVSVATVSKALNDHRDVGEEVLSELLAEVNIVDGHDVLNGANVGEIHTDLFRFF